MTGSTALVTPDLLLQVNIFMEISITVARKLNIFSTVPTGSNRKSGTLY
jgi:hypothetical protein